MQQIPTSLLNSLTNLEGFDKEAFERVHASGEQVTSIRFNPAKTEIKDNEQGIKNNEFPDKSPTSHSPLTTASPVPWSSYGYYLPERPSFTFDPLFHAGTYYVQEASSMFLEQALKQTADLSQPLRVLDLCAAPGGKSTLLQSLINKESLLVSNEVIKSRAAVLEENITKWGAANVVITNNDPVHFARLENYFDVIMIDAPCSGSGLFRRDPDAIHEWSENNVQLCSQRQQRIIADVWPALKQGGILIYSTCSYSKEEDESILDWICEGFTVEGLRLKLDKEWHIIETISEKHHAYGYRFYPDKVKGEGFFIAALQKKEGAAFAGIKPGKTKTEKLSKSEEAIVQPWLQEDADLVLFKQKDDIIALPSCLEKEILVLQSALYIKKAGITLGKLAGKDLIPDHALAVSTIINKNIVCIELSREQAIQYLRREEMPLDTLHKGWALVAYHGHNLGWIKVLSNRFNNYYPKEWRIVKQPGKQS
jgi:16S rRNA C967 or C1407 C5-methylase (RsmB/RsmF family)/NOL1/NOP2/fmu family ribosome biogenesis protein